MAGSRNNRSIDDTVTSVIRSIPNHGPLIDAARRFLCALPSELRVGHHVVALSGGRDSMALLYVLAKLRQEHNINLSAVHVHHGLSPNADVWLRRCADICLALGIEFSGVRVSVSLDSGEGLEGAARSARYAVFDDVAANAIWLAHHADDQAETLLFNLIRGGGVAGASGMPSERRLHRGTELLRPWLDIPRAVIDAFVLDSQIDYLDDESNQDTRLSRNFLRHEVMPAIERRFPDVAVRLAATSRHMAEAQQLLDDLARMDAVALLQDRRVDLAVLQGLDRRRQKNFLRWWLRTLKARLGERALDEWLRQLGGAASEAEFRELAAGWRFQVWRSGLHAIPIRDEDRNSKSFVWRGEPESAWQGGVLRFTRCQGSGLRLPVDGTVVVSLRQGGERIALGPARPRRTVKNLLQEAAVPPWEREAWPLVWVGGVLASVRGVGEAASFCVASDEAGWQLTWCPLRN